jgi:hypothetical protein
LIQRNPRPRNQPGVQLRHRLKTRRMCPLAIQLPNLPMTPRTSRRWSPPVRPQPRNPLPCPLTGPPRSRRILLRTIQLNRRPTRQQSHPLPLRRQRTSHHLNPQRIPRTPLRRTQRMCPPISLRRCLRSRLQRSRPTRPLAIRPSIRLNCPPPILLALRLSRRPWCRPSSQLTAPLMSRLRPHVPHTALTKTRHIRLGPWSRTFN